METTTWPSSPLNTSDMSSFTSSLFITVITNSSANASTVLASAPPAAPGPGESSRALEHMVALLTVGGDVIGVSSFVLNLVFVLAVHFINTSAYFHYLQVRGGGASLAQCGVCETEKNV